MLKRVTGLQWRDWLRGLIGAAASGVVTAIGTVSVIQTSVGDAAKVGVIAAVWSIVKYLAQRPLPEEG